MTYEEALEHRKEVEKIPLEEGQTYKYLIIPELHEDQDKFFENYDEDTYTDQDCKKYSSNSQFTVRWELDYVSKERINKSKNRGR